MRAGLALPGRQGAGSVHHIAWGTTMADQPAWLARLDELRIPNSGVVDRHYFQSVYFHEPNGILYELATGVLPWPLKRAP